MDKYESQKDVKMYEWQKNRKMRFCSFIRRRKLLSSNARIQANRAKPS